jgi:hypothetical protein
MTCRPSVPTAAALALCCAATAWAPAPAAAQSGSGTTTAAVLQLPAGSRAGALGGAYTAAGDGDVLFYNPAGAAWLNAAAGVAYQRHIADIGFSTIAAAASIGRASIGLTFGVLDYGTIDELVPDPAFDDQRGIETGERLGANDAVGRVTIAAPLFGRRLAVGASIGLLWITLAESARTATVYDVGLQYRARDGLTVGAALRNAGDPLEGANLVPADLPTEVRAGLAWAVPAEWWPRARFAVHADVIEPLNDGATALATGVEVRTPPGTGPGAGLAHGVEAAVRIGYNGTAGAGGLGRLHLGAGLTLHGLAVDYMIQSLGDLGTAHRVGVRVDR